MSGFNVAVYFGTDGPWIVSIKPDRAEWAVFTEGYPIQYEKLMLEIQWYHLDPGEWDDWCMIYIV